MSVIRLFWRMPKLFICCTASTHGISSLALAQENSRRWSDGEKLGVHLGILTSCASVTHWVEKNFNNKTNRWRTFSKEWRLQNYTFIRVVFKRYITYKVYFNHNLLVLLFITWVWLKPFTLQLCIAAFASFSTSLSYVLDPLAAPLKATQWQSSSHSENCLFLCKEFI